MAKDLSVRSPSARRSSIRANTVFSVKRLIGRKFRDSEIEQSQRRAAVSADGGIERRCRHRGSRQATQTQRRSRPLSSGRSRRLRRKPWARRLPRRSSRCRPISMTLNVRPLVTLAASRVSKSYGSSTSRQPRLWPTASTPRSGGPDGGGLRPGWRYLRHLDSGTVAGDFRGQVDRWRRLSRW